MLLVLRSGRLPKQLRVHVSSYWRKAVEEVHLYLQLYLRVIEAWLCATFLTTRGLPLDEMLLPCLGGFPGGSKRGILRILVQSHHFAQQCTLFWDVPLIYRGGLSFIMIYPLCLQVSPSCQVHSFVQNQLFIEVLLGL